MSSMNSKTFSLPSQAITSFANSHRVVTSRHSAVDTRSTSYWPAEERGMYQSVDNKLQSAMQEQYLSTHVSSIESSNTSSERREIRQIRSFRAL